MSRCKKAGTLSERFWRDASSIRRINRGKLRAGCSEFCPSFVALMSGAAKRPPSFCGRGGDSFHGLPRSGWRHDLQLRYRSRTFRLKEKILQADREAREPLRV